MGKKVKVVFDTNVWISIFMKKTLAEKFSAILEKIEVYVTDEIVKEISRVLVYSKIQKLLTLAGVSEREIIRKVLKNSTLIKPKFRLKVIKEDQEDNKILDCALQARVDFIVSGNKHLLKLRKFKNMKILTPREFLDIVGSS